jgi:hypothetical protein
VENSYCTGRGKRTGWTSPTCGEMTPRTLGQTADNGQRALKPLYIESAFLDAKTRGDGVGWRHPEMGFGIMGAPGRRTVGRELEREAPAWRRERKRDSAGACKLHAGLRTAILAAPAHILSQTIFHGLRLLVRPVSRRRWHHRSILPQESWWNQGLRYPTGNTTAARDERRCRPSPETMSAYPWAEYLAGQADGTFLHFGLSVPVAGEGAVAGGFSSL